MNLKFLPKIELHCHLDASVRLATAAEIASEIGREVPGSIEEALVAPETCNDLRDYLRRIEFAVELMQRPEDLTRIARELVQDMAADGVIYGEIRFAPQLHMRQGLSPQQVLDAVHAGLDAGQKQQRVRMGLILCCLRHQSPAESLAVARLAVDNQEKVCALDLAGDEARFPGYPHAPAFALAREAGLRRTVHAGEAAGAHSVREALDVLSAERLGHGVRVGEQAALVEEIREKAIPLEMCPRSNVQTRAAESYQAHPIDRFLKQSLRITVSTDGRTTSATSVTREFEQLFEKKGWGPEEFWRCQRNAAEAAFVPPAAKQELLAKITTVERASRPEGGKPGQC